MYKVILVGLVLALAAPVAMSVPGSAQPLDVRASSFADQRAEIEKQLADGKTYAEIGSSDRAKVRAALSRIATNLESKGSADALNEMQKVEVFNDQETINTILTRASADSRIICTREKKLGSHRPINKCLTVAERRRSMEGGQDMLRNAPPPQLKGN